MKVKGKILALVLTTVMAMSLVGCGIPKTTDQAATTQEATPAETETETETTDAATAGDEPITLRIVDWSDSSAALRKAFHEQYMKDHPNITIEYTTLTIDQFKSTVVTSIKSGDAPDLFPVPTGMSLAATVKEGWYQPLDELMPADFWSTLDTRVLVDGVSKYDGKFYSIPEVKAITSALLYYNKDILAEAGIKEVPKTFSEFVAACKTVSEKGQGQYYGLIEGGKQVNRMYTLISSFANVGGAQLPQFSKALTLNGRINYDSQAVKNAFELFKQLKADGSLHPDAINITAPEAREYFAQGQAAFIMQGNWCISTWQATYPDLNYGVMAVPVPDDGAKGAIAVEQNAPWIGIYSQSKHPKEAAEYLQALYSYTEGYTYQEELVGKAGQLSIVNGVVEENLSNEHALEYYTIATEASKDIPNATLRDLGVYDMYAAVIDVQPSFGALFQGLISGGLDDYSTALTTLSDSLTAEWKRAAEAVGADFSALEFPNWDPMKDYEEADYKSLN